MKDHQYVELYTTSYLRDEAEWFLETWKRTIEKHEQLHGVAVLWYECSTVETFERESHLSNGILSVTTPHYRPTFLAVVNKNWVRDLDSELRWVARAHPMRLDTMTYWWRLHVLRQYPPYTFAFDVEAQRMRNIDI